jgi:predicted RNA-binding protein with PUA-like domain
MKAEVRHTCLPAFSLIPHPSAFIVMQHWLLKTEPSTYSADDLKAAKVASWDGVANATALIHLRAMKKGDRCLIYHTGAEKRCVAVAEVVKAAYPDPKLDDPKLVVVDLKFVKMLKTPVTLEQIKADKAFAGWDLLRIGRLSVVPTLKSLWERVMELAGP